MNRNPMTVTQITSYLKFIIEEDDDLKSVLVKGEVSNYKLHSSGHIYFTLKDENAKIKCVMFRSYASRMLFKLEDGMKIIIDGYISIYEKEGQYQLYCYRIQPDGVGSLYLKFEQLKNKLASEGLFDEERKKKLPAFPKKIGVITSPTGAVIKDILNVSKRRFKGIDILIYPSKVQGDDAADSIVSGVEYFNKRNDVDVVIIARGGGSIEELWAFNEEKVARAVAFSNKVIVSAVGHETDFTLCDFAADVRASTPSHAAEIVVPSYDELKYKIESTKDNIISIIKRYLNEKTMENEEANHLLSLNSPQYRISQYMQYIDGIDGKMMSCIKSIISNCSNEYSILFNKVDSLNPLKVLNRGYSIVKKDDFAVNSIKSIKIKDNLKILFEDGNVDCIVSNVLEGGIWQEEKRV